MISKVRGGFKIFHIILVFPTVFMFIKTYKLSASLSFGRVSTRFVRHKTVEHNILRKMSNLLVVGCNLAIQLNELVSVLRCLAERGACISLI